MFFTPIWAMGFLQQLLKDLLENDKTWLIKRLHNADVHMVRNYILHNSRSRYEY